jgi:anti-anti-sigma regulatory factor
MLKITHSAKFNEQRWILCGQLAGPWVAELRSNWDQVRDGSRGRRYVIDLSDVTLIDESGQALLGELRDQGAEFVARGVYTRHLLEDLKCKLENFRCKEDRARKQTHG